MDVREKLIDLKPCPFCGGEARIRTGVTSSVPKLSKALVICQKCLASTDWFCDTAADAEFVFEAIEAWNRRAGKENDYETD